MSWVPAEQVLRTIAEQREAVTAEQARVTEFSQYHEAERRKLQGERDAATHDLAQALLASLDPAVIASAAEIVGMPGLPSEDIPAKLVARRQALVHRIAVIERDPRFVNRELLRHPRTGSLTRELAEAEEMQKPALGVIQTCEAHLRFERLWQNGFGTPEFGNPWWRYSYWEDRSAAAEIVALVPGSTTFAEVREAYRSAKETAATFHGEIARLRGELAACDALAREHVELLDEHAHLDERVLAHTQRRIVEHLLTSDASLVSQRLEASGPRASAIRLLFLRASGITAKIDYLDGMQRAHLAELQKELATQAQRLSDVEFRTRRRWAAMPLDKWQKLAVDRRPRYEKRWQRFGKVYQSVHTYERWDRGQYYDDILWWDLMTRGRYDGSYLPEVAEFHRQHPDYQFDPDYRTLKAEYDARLDADRDAEAQADIDRDAEAAAAGIEADTSLDPADDLSTVDAS
jgi:hypothetical protein